MGRVVCLMDRTLHPGKRKTVCVLGPVCNCEEQGVACSP